MRHEPLMGLYASGMSVALPTWGSRAHTLRLARRPGSGDLAMTATKEAVCTARAAQAELAVSSLRRDNHGDRTTHDTQ